MRNDLYTKVALTAIVALLAVIALKLPWNKRQDLSVASAPPAVTLASSLEDVSYASCGGGQHCLFDRRTGDFWAVTFYSDESHMAPKWEYMGRITKLGGPVEKSANQFNETAPGSRQ